MTVIYDHMMHACMQQVLVNDSNDQQLACKLKATIFASMLRIALHQAHRVQLESRIEICNTFAVAYSALPYVYTLHRWYPGGLAFAALGPWARARTASQACPAVIIPVVPSLRRSFFLTLQCRALACLVSRQVWLSPKSQATVIEGSSGKQSCAVMGPRHTIHKLLILTEAAGHLGSLAACAQLHCCTHQNTIRCRWILDQYEPLWILPE